MGKSLTGRPSEPRTMPLILPFGQAERFWDSHPFSGTTRGPLGHSHLSWKNSSESIRKVYVPGGIERNSNWPLESVSATNEVSRLVAATFTPAIPISEETYSCNRFVTRPTSREGPPASQFRSASRSDSFPFTLKEKEQGLRLTRS